MSLRAASVGFLLLLGQAALASAQSVAFGARDGASVPDSVVALPDGDVVVVGRTRGAFGTHSSDFESSDAFVARVGPRGELRWARQWGDPGAQEEASAVALRAGAILVAVQHNGSRGIPELAVPAMGSAIVELDLDGRERSRFVVRGLVNDLAVDPLGTDVALCMREADPRSGTHWVVSRHRADGRRVWARRSPASQRSSEPGCMALDWRGDRIAASGYAHRRVLGARLHVDPRDTPEPGERGAVTLLLEARRGRTLWARQWIGAHHFAHDVAIGEDGTVYVAAGAIRTYVPPTRYEPALLGYSPDGSPRFVALEPMVDFGRGRDVVRASGAGVLWAVSNAGRPIAQGGPPLSVQMLSVDSSGAVTRLARVDAIHSASDLVAGVAGWQLLGIGRAATPAHRPGPDGDPAIVRVATR
ncbi:MAG: hypothetical protein K8H88_22100 [Sandaracinaceae bacterium]|nr:hypothetical protein [Sandaracinaceae bacterium]